MTYDMSQLICPGNYPLYIHICFCTPTQDGKIFLHRKVFRSLRMQVVCIGKSQIVDMGAKFPEQCTQSEAIHSAARMRIQDE